MDNIFIFVLCILMPAKKSVAPKAVASKVEKILPPVRIEMKKIEKSECCDTTNSCCPSSTPKCCGKLIKLGLLVLNTILLIVVIVNQKHIEEMKVGGAENYKMLKTLFTSEGFKNYQKAQIEQTMQMLKQQSATAGQQKAPQGQVPAGQAVQAPAQQ